LERPYSYLKLGELLIEQADRLAFPSF